MGVPPNLVIAWHLGDASPSDATGAYNIVLLIFLLRQRKAKTLKILYQDREAGKEAKLVSSGCFLTPLLATFFPFCGYTESPKNQVSVILNVVVRQFQEFVKVLLSVRNIHQVVR